MGDVFLGDRNPDMTVPYWVLVRVVPPHRTPPTPYGPGEARLGLVGGVEVASVEGAGVKDADPAVEVVAGGPRPKLGP